MRIAAADQDWLGDLYEHRLTDEAFATVPEVLMGAYCACLGMIVNSILVRNLPVIELTARLGADINQ
eukprot:COSAG02_NODE_16760_length_1057_cov_3.386221_1_plen_67_part_00